MLTARGWWFLTLTALLALLGVVGVGYSDDVPDVAIPATVPILGLTLVVWLLVEWCVFAYRLRASADRLTVERVLLQGGRAVPAVWAGSRFTVRVTVTSHGTARLPFVLLTDRPPADLSATDAVNQRAFDLRPNEPAVIEYELRADGPGVVRFEGVQVRVADLAGLFYRRLFVRAPVEYLVLPPLTDDEGHHRGVKRFNTLPPPGTHRLRRAGGGGELLDLREYRPGDPPKMIAWKASARRDQLITKEFESEVPVRCVLFLDASTGARVGPPGRAPVVRLAEVGAAVAQAASAHRDLVGLTVFDEETAAVTAPARTRIHTVELLRKLGEAAARLPNPGPANADLLARTALPLAEELYPDLMRPDVNSRPWRMYWRPVADSRWLWVVLALLCLPALLVRPAGIEALARAVNALSRDGWSVFAKLGLALFLFFLPLLLAGGIWFVHGVRGLLPPLRARLARRKPLAALFALLDDTGPAAVERFIVDDEHFAERATRFLLDHRVRLPLVLYDKQGRYRFRGEGKIPVLAAALLRAVGRARDNELYVVLADLAELGRDVQPLVNAAIVARARHHQVLVIVPWPADLPTEEQRPGSAKIGAVVRSVLISRYQRGYAELRSELARAGATATRVTDGDPVQLVLERLNQLRGARIRR